MLNLLLIVGAISWASIKYQRLALMSELSLYLLVWWIAYLCSLQDTIWLTISVLMQCLLLFTHNQSNPSTRRSISKLFIIIILWLLGFSDYPNHAIKIVLMISSFMTIISYFLYIWQSSAQKPIESIDIVLSSYSGNTADMVNHWISHLNPKWLVNIHRLHYINKNQQKQIQLNASALVVAFPVAGWGPFWPMFMFLWHLPKGYGKPAIILYSSAGGPENAYVIAWILMILKGYHVRGRMGLVYPVTVTQFRPLPHKWANVFDQLILKYNNLNHPVFKLSAFYFNGDPIVVWPFILSLAYPLFYNPWLNRLIFFNYRYVERCNYCQICVHVCPTGRLSFNHKRLQTKGDCILCFSCINSCPTSSMQALLLSELGSRYLHPDSSCRVTQRVIRRTLPNAGLLSLIQRIKQNALKKGILIPLVTSEHYYTENSFTYHFNIIKSTKKNITTGIKKASINPFMNIDSALYVCQVGEDYYCCLNKFPIFEDHLLLITSAYIPQMSGLTLSDFTAIWQLLTQIDGFVFFNKGTIAGASQLHKHIQLLPYESNNKLTQNQFIEMMENESTFNFPFHQIKQTFNYNTITVNALFDTYLYLNNKLNNPNFFNFLMTRNSMMIIPRKAEGLNNISLNSLGFIGNFLCQDEEEMQELRDLTLEKLYEKVVDESLPS